MPGLEDERPSPFAPLQADVERMKRSNLTTAIDDVDQVIDLLMSAREQVAGGKVMVCRGVEGGQLTSEQMQTRTTL